MSFGKVTAVVLGGVMVVGTLGMVVVNGSLAMDSGMPVGPFVIQVPNDLFALRADDALVVAPEIIEAPEEGLTALQAVEQLPAALVAPEFESGRESAPAQDIEVVRLNALAAQAEMAAQAQAVAQVQTHALGMCGAAH